MSLLIEHAGQEQLRQEIDETGAADALGTGLADGAVLHASHQGYLLYRPVAGTHAVADLSPFKGRTGGGRAGQQPILVAEHHLPVGPHVDQEADALVLGHAAGHHVRHHVAAHVAGSSGHQVHRGSGIDVEAQLAGVGPGREVRHRGIGSVPDASGVQPEQHMHHGGVACDADGHDLLGADLPSLADADLIVAAYPGQHVVDGVDYHVPQAFLAVVLTVHYARQHVLAVHQLAVVVGDLGDHLPGAEVHQLQGHGGGPDVDGHPVVPGDAVPRTHVHQNVPVQEGGDRPFALPDHLGQLPEQRERHLQRARFVAQLLQQALQVRIVVLEGGRTQFGVDRPH